MKIIKQGTAECEKVYVHTCIYCKTIFTYNMSEVTYTPDGRNYDFWYACTCPYDKCRKPQHIRKLELYKSNVDPY